jgi:hypothetical protein
MVDNLARLWRGRPHAVFRMHAMTAFLTMLKEKKSINGEYVGSVEAGIEELADGALSYYDHSSLSRALCHLDNACVRVAYKVVRRLAMPQIRRMFEGQSERLAVIDQLGSVMSVASNVVTLTGLIAEYAFWRNMAFGDVATALKGIENLQSLENKIEALPETPFPIGDGIIAAFGHYGIGHDMLLMGAWDVLHIHQADVAASALPARIKEFASRSHAEAQTMIPPEPRPSS